MALQEWKAGDIITAERLNEINNIISSLYPEVTVGPSSVIDINDAVPLVPNALAVTVTPIQTGEGDPSPTNIRPITGWTGANLYHGTSTDDPNAQTYAFSFPAAAGTVYGGTLDVLAGTLTVTCLKITLDTIGDRTLTDLGDCLRLGITHVLADGSISSSSSVPQIWTLGTTNARANWLKQATPKYDLNEAGFYIYGGHAFYVKFPKPKFSGNADINAYLAEHPLEIYVGDLIDPPTYQLTPAQITMLTGTNTLWTDTGDMTLTYQVNPYDKLLELIHSYHPETTLLQSVSPLNTSAENEETTSEEET